MQAETSRHHHLGSLLVTLQFGLMGLLGVLGGPAFLHGRAGAHAWLLALVGLGVGLWAVAANRPGNFNIRPTPREGGHLIEHGPYRWIRHPMYTAVLLLAAAGAMGSASVLAWLAALALVAVLTVKSTFEERWMIAAHPDYATYRTRTHRFLPFLL